MKNETQEISPEDWSEIAPLLDEQLNRLGERDRDAVVLRYFQNRSFADVGEELGLTPDAARKRVERALERLRGFLAGRGVTAPAAAIGAGIAAFAVTAAPSHAAAAVTTTAATTQGIQFAKGAIKMMFWTKAKIALATAAAVLFVAGGATVVIPRAFAQQTTTGVINLNGGGMGGTFVPAGNVTFTINSSTTTQPAGQASTEPAEGADGPFDFDLSSGDLVNLELPSAFKFDFRAPTGADETIVRNVYTTNGPKMKDIDRLLGARYRLEHQHHVDHDARRRAMKGMGFQFMLDAHNGDSLAPVDSENWTNSRARNSSRRR